eukprot:8319513-Alexandrium_andersonii.AAC.1
MNPAASVETRQQVARDTDERVPLPAWRQSFSSFYRTIVSVTTRASAEPTEAAGEQAPTEGHLAD